MERKEKIEKKLEIKMKNLCEFVGKEKKLCDAYNEQNFQEFLKIVLKELLEMLKKKIV